MRIRKCTHCGSTEVVDTAYGVECCRCGFEMDVDRDEERVRDALNNMLEEMTCPDDDEGKVSVLGSIIRVAEELRKKLEAWY